MLTFEDLASPGDYNYSASLSPNEDPLMSDYLDGTSDDFLQQLSSDLDIPLLLNPEEDELGMLNSLLDKSPDEILSEISSPFTPPEFQLTNEIQEAQDFDISQYTPNDFPNMHFSEMETDMDIKSECLSESDKSHSPTPSQSSESSSIDIKEEFLTPPISPNNNYTIPLISNINETLKNTSTNLMKNLVTLTTKNGQLKILPQKNMSSKTPYIVPKAKNGANIQEKIVLNAHKQQHANILIKNPNSNPKVVVLPANAINKLNAANNSHIKIDAASPLKIGHITPQQLKLNGNMTPTQGKNDVPAQSAVKIGSVTPPRLNCLKIDNFEARQVTPPCINLNGMVVIKNEPLLSAGMDEKAFKRQQRMIKNRESANLSRKKKKEYLTSLEKQVQDLTEENHQLKIENSELKQRLTGYISGKTISSINFLGKNKTLAKSVALCMCFFVVCLNVDFTRKSLINAPPLNSENSQGFADISSHRGRGLLWTPETETAENVSTNNVLPLPVCPMYINQSESVRLALELHRWIGKPFNMTDAFVNKNTESIPKVKSRHRSKQKRRTQVYPDTLMSNVYKWGRKRKIPDQISGNELQIFAPTPEQIYAEFFEAINRKDDTFYVVSFSPDHMLLPALHHNKTRRPKMSLIMPTMLPNGSASNQTNLVPLMQIDCEVINTRLIYVENESIPQHMRTGNGTQAPLNTENEEKPLKMRRHRNKPYKPYFLNQRPTTNTSVKLQETLDDRNNVK